MNKALVVALIVLALAFGFAGGTITASLRQPVVVSSGLTSYERGQLIVGCYGIAEVATRQTTSGPINLNYAPSTTSAPSGALPGSRDACLSAVKAIP